MAEEDAPMGDAEVEPEEGAEPNDEDATMKEAEADGDAEAAPEAEAAEEKPKVPEKPKELEEDAPADSRPKLPAGAATFFTDDTTLNVMPTLGGKMLMCLSDGGFQYLLAGARASVGLKAGRYMFEVLITETKNMSEPKGAQQGPKPKSLVRVGFSTAESSLVLASDDLGVCFDCEGNFVHGRTKTKVSQRFGHGQVVSVLLNLDPKSPNANTVSLFRDGVRVAQPQKLPEGLCGKALFPAVAYRNASLQVHFGPAPLRPLPFKCLTLQEAAKADCEAKTEAKKGTCEVLLPVGLPDEGTFDWLDKFLEKNRNYVELSDRALMDWAQKSGLNRQGGFKTRSSNDKPEFSFGLPLMEDMTVQRVIKSVAPMLQRNFIIMEVKGNLLAESRKAALEPFAGSDFKKVVQVVMGEPPADYKKWVQETTLKAKQEKQDLKVKRQRAELARKKEEEARKKKSEEERKKRIEAAKKAREAREAKARGEEPPEEKEAEAEAEAKEDEPMEEAAEEETIEDVVVELTDDEKKLCFIKRDIPDLSSKELSAAYTKFTLPQKEEGFDEIKYLWKPEADCKEYLKQWVSERKLTQRVEDLQPSDWFKKKHKEWMDLMGTWRKKQAEFKDPAKRKAAAAKKKAEGAGEEGAAEEKEAEPQEEINAEDLDVFAVEDVCDIGNGEPLFANFAFEDWALLTLRFELHLLVHAFRHDLDDPERTAFHQHNIYHYYGKYYRRQFALKNFGVTKLSELVNLIKDTVEISDKNSTLESQLSDDTPMDNFIKLTEDHRRDRQSRVDGGDEAAALKFPRPLPGKGSGKGGAGYEGDGLKGGKGAPGPPMPPKGAPKGGSKGPYAGAPPRPAPYAAPSYAAPSRGTYGTGAPAPGGSAYAAQKRPAPYGATASFPPAKRAEHSFPGAYGGGAGKGGKGGYGGGGGGFPPAGGKGPAPSYGGSKGGPSRGGYGMPSSGPKGGGKGYGR